MQHNINATFLPIYTIKYIERNYKKVTLNNVLQSLFREFQAVCVATDFGRCCAVPQLHKRCIMVDVIATNGQSATITSGDGLAENEQDAAVRNEVLDDAASETDVSSVKDENANCVVCTDGGWSDENKILFCEGKGCRVVVHQDCYGIVKVPEGKWLCDLCKAEDVNRKEVTCAICDGGTNMGAMKRAASGKFYHSACALASPEVSFDTLSKLEGIRGLESFLLFSRRSMQCVLCDRSHGAAVMCMKPGCNATFHVKCGQKAGCDVELKPYASTKQVYCAMHRGNILPEKRKRRFGGASKRARTRTNSGSSSPRLDRGAHASHRRVSALGKYTWSDIAKMYNQKKAAELRFPLDGLFNDVFGEPHRRRDAWDAPPLGEHYLDVWAANDGVTKVHTEPFPSSARGTGARARFSVSCSTSSSQVRSLDLVTLPRESSAYKTRGFRKRTRVLHYSTNLRDSWSMVFPWLRP